MRYFISPLSREVHERRGRRKSNGAAASSDCCGASPVVPTDPPQAEGNIASGEVVACRMALLRLTTVAAPPQSFRLTLRKRRETSLARGRRLSNGAAASSDCCAPPQSSRLTLRKRGKHR